MIRKYDTIIIGAGPGGLKCAEVLLKADKKVLILEKSKKIKRKICAGMYGVSERYLKFLPSEKLLNRKYSEMIVKIENEEFLIKRDYNFVATINRKELSKFQIKRIKVLKGKIIFGAEVKKTGKDYIVAGKDKFYFKYLVGADGSNSIVRKSLGLKFDRGMAFQYWFKTNKFDKPFIYYDYTKFGPFYLWVAPHKDIVSIGFGSSPKYCSASEAKSNLINWLKNKGFKPNKTFEAAPINCLYQGYDFGNIFLIGDAAGFPSRLTGEGIIFAFASGYDVANKILDKNYECENIKYLLSKKKKHEFLFNLLTKEFTRRKLFKFGKRLLKNPSFQDKFIEFVA